MTTDTSDSSATPPTAATPPPSSYSGSPFHPSRYEGIRDAVRQNEKRAMHNRRADRAGWGLMAVLVLMAAGLGGIAGGAWAVWDLTDDGLVQSGVRSP